MLLGMVGCYCGLLVLASYGGAYVDAAAFGSCSVCSFLVVALCCSVFSSSFHTGWWLLLWLYAAVIWSSSAMPLLPFRFWWM